MSKQSVTEGTISAFQFMARFPTEQAAREHIERLRWGNSPVCPKCASDKISHRKNEKPMPYRCRECKKDFSVKTGTIFQGSNLELRKCLYAIYLITVGKKGISSCQLAREIGCTQKTAWYLGHRIREAYGAEPEMLSGTVEVDETYFGGKEKNKHASKKLRAGRGAVGKAAVVGIRVRETGRVIAQPIRSTTASELQGFIHSHVERGSTVYTDGSTGYDGLDIGGKHESVNHSVGEYVRNQAHTNGIESVWALIKRGYQGTYHHFSVDHLHRYVNEFAVRYNRRKWSSMAQIDQAMREIFNKTLGYKALTK